MLRTNLALNHYVSTEYLEVEEVAHLIERALEFKNMPEHLFPQYSDQYISNLFFENSTRTHLSFEVAERKLGMNVIPFDPSTSSINKGETLLDTAITLEALGIDTVVVRSKEQEYYQQLINSQDLNLSIINGGDGSGQHPSQSLLDIMTIYEEFRSFSGVKIAIVGDLAHSRVARSNAELLSRLGAVLYFSGPEEWYDSSFDAYGTFVPLDQVIEELDVVMLLRVQFERHTNKSFLDYKIYHECYGLTEIRAQKMPHHGIIMHPAPVNRDVEIADSLVTATQSRIITQMQNGVFARMAILEAVMNGKR